MWDRAYQIMEECWTRDEDSRPRMSVIFEAQWQFLNQREPEDMKNFQNFIENSRELPGPPIPFGTHWIFVFAPFDAVLNIVFLRFGSTRRHDCSMHIHELSYCFKGDFQYDDESDDEVIRISHDDEPDRTYSVETPDGHRQFREIRQKTVRR